MKAALLSLIIAAVSISSLVPMHAASARTIKAKYDCRKGPTLTVLFKDNKATVTPKGKASIVLRQGLAADGFLYTKGKYSLRGKGDWATWTVGKNRPLNCRAR